MRQFETGATRDSDDTKPSYRGFMCPLVQRRFGEYMLEHQRQPDGTKREPDNWKKGIPSKVYMDSLMRHVQELWEMFEFQRPVQEPPHASIDWAPAAVKRYEDALAAILFNTQGLLRNSLLGRKYEQRYQSGALEREIRPDPKGTDPRLDSMARALAAELNSIPKAQVLGRLEGVTEDRLDPEDMSRLVRAEPLPPKPLPKCRTEGRCCECNAPIAGGECSRSASLSLRYEPDGNHVRRGEVR